MRMTVDPERVAPSLVHNDLSMAVIRHRALEQFQFVRDVTKDAFDQWLTDRASRMSASLAFYMIFSVAPSFIIIVAIVAFVFGDVAARNALEDYLRDYVGPTGIELIVSIAEQATSEGAGPWMTMAGAVLVIVGATVAFSDLHDAMNIIWKVPTRTGLKGFLYPRLVGFVVVIGLGLLLLISVALSAVGAVASGMLNARGLQAPALFSLLEFVVSFVLGTLAFSAIYYYVPDTPTRFRHAWTGGLVTAILFTPGKLLLAAYLGTVATLTVYGTAASFVTILLWIYYSALVFFFGAVWVRAYAARCASRTPESARG